MQDFCCIRGLSEAFSSLKLFDTRACVLAATVQDTCVMLLFLQCSFRFLLKKVQMCIFFYMAT